MARTRAFTRIPRRALLRSTAAIGAITTLAWGAGARGFGRAAVAAGTAAMPDIPETTAGRKLAQWLAAVNARDVDALLAFHRSIAEEQMAVGRTTFDLINSRSRGTVELHGVVESAENRIVALLSTVLTEEWLHFELDLERGGPEAMGFRPAMPPATAGAGVLSDGEIGGELGRYLDKLAAADAFSGAVLLARDGAPFFTAAHGRAHQATDQPNRLSTRFNLGSMNKMFTAISVAQLVQQGRLAFTDTLGALLLDYPDRDAAERITVHQLLTHTSGMGDFFGPRYDREKDHIRAPREYFPMFTGRPLRFEPGTDWSYSNAGFIVLGAIVEQVSGWDYFDYVREHVYRPAGMVRSDSFERDAAVPDLATGYTIPLPDDPRDLRPEVAFQPRVENTAWLGIKGSPAGGGYSTVDDLLAFAGALRGHRLLSAEYTETVLAGKVETMGGPPGRYAYGFIDAVVGGARIVGHGGGAPGINANLDVFLDRGVTAVVLANYDQVAQTVTQKIRRLVTQR